MIILGDKDKELADKVAGEIFDKHGDKITMDKIDFVWHQVCEAVDNDYGREFAHLNAIQDANHAVKSYIMEKLGLD